MSGTVDPLLLTGRLLVHAGLVSEERLETTLRNQAGHRALRWPGKKLGHHLIVENVVNQEILEALIRARDSAPVDAGRIHLGEIAVRNGFLREDELAECLREQAAARESGTAAERLGRVLVRKGLMSEHRLQAILDRQRILREKASATVN